MIDVSDRSYLEWPFFSDEHRSFEKRFRQWVTGVQVSSEETPPGLSARRWVSALAFEGWLQLCLDLDVGSLCLARESLAYHDPLGDFAFAMQGLGSAPISLFGTPQQKMKYLPSVTSGESIMAFALSEREAGSDVAATVTSARRDDEFYILNGEKTWISNAGIAGTYVVFARTSEGGAKGLSAFIVPARTPGLHVTEEIETISPHPLGTLRFHNATVPAQNRLGEEGQGFKIAMAT
ncbi:MAG TPA: acyl-CoA dehydrogenase family protein, partial [Candidatus Baltobacteraceae bacterium]|nr:acyl-CoA dehydrogenase family protein [Candidatus Baltobacteraceae bacterium]